MAVGDAVRKFREAHERAEGQSGYLRDYHLGRLMIYIMRDGNGALEGVNLLVSQNPSKTYPAGELQLENRLVIYPYVRSL